MSIDESVLRGCCSRITLRHAASLLRAVEFDRANRRTMQLMTASTLRFEDRVLRMQPVNVKTGECAPPQVLSGHWSSLGRLFSG